MANEFVTRNGLISLDSSQITGSLSVTQNIIATSITGSLSGIASTASLAFTASSADNFFVRQNATASNILVNNTLTAQTLVVQTVTSSIVYSSGSNIFGNQLTNVQQFTGSLRATGSGNHFIMGGNVGVGLTGSYTRFQVAGSTQATAAASVARLGFADSSSVALFMNGDPKYGTLLGTLSTGEGWIQQQRVDGTATSYNLLLQPNGGNVGINATAPGARLEVSGSSNEVVLLVDSPASSNSLVVSGSGNVGIGTTTLPAKLSVSGSTVAASFQGSGSAMFTVDGTSGRLFQIDDSLSGSLFSVNTAAGLPVIEAFSNNTVRIGQFGQQALFVSQSVVGVGVEIPTAKMQISGSNTQGILRINSPASGSILVVSGSGNVGIGTSSPIDKLTVSGRINILGTNQNSIWFNQNAGGSSTGFILGRSTGTDDAQNFFLYDVAAAAFRTVVNSSGNVGIGTTSISSRLDVRDSSTTNINIASFSNTSSAANTTKAASISLNLTDTVGTNKQVVGLRAFTDGTNVLSGGLAFDIRTSDTTPVEVIRIASTGNLGINATAPAARLEVSGSNTQGILRINSPVSASILVVSGSGLVGINTASPTTALDVNGTGRFTTVVETSTRTLKDNIQPYTTEVATFNQLEPVSFTWKDTGKKDIGLIAEDVELLFPEFVHKTNEGEIQGINYGKLTVVLINIVKDYKQRIELLEQQVKKLIS